MDETKDRRINVRLDEDTFFALKKIVERDLKTDISSYTRSLLWVSTLHDATIHKIRNAVIKFTKEMSTEDLEYMLTIKNQIEFVEKFLMTSKENRKKYDEFISMIEKWHETIKNEARNYFGKYNEIIDHWEKENRNWRSKENEESPTGDVWRKINI
jgi:hypothetical protein